MAQKTFTKRFIDSLEVRAERYAVYDTKVAGFRVRVSPDGSKVFSLVYRGPSGRRSYNIGRFGELTVEQARKLAEDARTRLRHGGDPSGEREARQAAPTVAELGVDYLADVDERRKPKTAGEYRRQWDKDILPALGAKRVAAVTTADVVKLHRALRKRGSYIANRVLSLVSAFFGFAIRQGVRPRGTNPAQDVEWYDEEGRERFLTLPEIAALGEALTRAETIGLPPAPSRRRTRKVGKAARHRPKSADTPQPADPFAVAAIRFTLLSGWRKSEALALEWTAIDFERGIVMLPDSKNGRSPRQLGASALALLGELPRVEGSPFCFPGRTADRPLASVRRVWEAVRYSAGLTGDVNCRLHDLRHTNASISASAGGSLLVIGALLGHKEIATTGKYAHLLNEPLRAAADATASTLERALRGKPSLRLAK